MQVNDRGTKKWTSIMIPEHVEALKKLFAEQDHKEKPILDEQQLLENGMLLQQAIQNDSMIEIKYYKDHDFYMVKGRVLFIQSQSRFLRLDNIKVNLDDIIEVNIL